MTAAGKEGSSQPAVLAQTAAILDEWADDVVASWVRRLEAELYPQRRGLGLEGLRDSAPSIVRGVAEALRGQPLSAEAAWIEPARQHAQTRLVQGVPLDCVMAEFQMLRQEMWRVLGQRLGGVAAQAVFDLAAGLDSALDVMAAVSVGAFSAGVQRVAARLLDRAYGLLGAVLQQMPSGVIIAEAPSGRLLLCNKRAKRIWRRPLPLPASIEEYASWEGYHADGRRYPPEEWPLSRSLRKGEVSTDEEIRIRRGDGTWGWISANSTPVRDGDIICAVTVFADVTARKRAEAMLERYRALFEHARDIILFVSPEDGRILEANEAAVRAYGYSRDELLRLTVYGLRAPETTPLVAAQMAEAAGRGILFETTHLRRDGRTFPVEVSSQWTPWDEGPALLSIIRDITERKQAEDALREAKEYAEQLIETANVMIIGLDAGGNIRVLNSAAEEITGYSRDELQGRNWFQVLVPRERYPQVWEVFSRAVSEGLVPRTFENPIVTRSGEERYILFRNSVLRQDGTITGTISFGIDITEQKQAEAERARLLEAEHRARQEAEAALRLRDEFLNVAAHELKTPLTSLRGHAELTMERIAQGRIRDVQEVHGALQVIDRQVDRLTNLVAQLLDITRIESGELQLEQRVVDLVPLVRRLVETMQAGATRHTLSLQAPESLPAFVDPVRLEEVLYNLLDNAIRYSPRGGPVEVELSTPDADTVRLAVRDYGIGVPPEQRERLFTRFFQAARRPAGGLGLGLYISRRIVELHGGRIWAEFPEDGGSRFVVELPREQSEESRGNEGARGTGGTGGTGSTV